MSYDDFPAPDGEWAAVAFQEEQRVKSRLLLSERELTEKVISAAD
jgi:hypothetical protein